MGAKKCLYNAALTGDLATLRTLLQQDPALLNRVSYTSPNKTPLHVATMHRNLAFVKEILDLNPQLAEVLDSQQSTALHIASAKGDLDIVRVLISFGPDLCFLRDCQGRNPLHLAAVKGHVHVLEELVRVAPVAAREKVDRGVSAMHLCVKHKQLEALKVLIPVLNEMIDAIDDYDGDTALHLAARDNQIEIIEYLVASAKANVNIRNSKGQTALEILEKKNHNPGVASEILRPHNSNKFDKTQWLAKKRDSIMVVAILIATMAFQAGITPPGGVWQDEKWDSPQEPPHKVGEAVIAHIYPRSYKNFLIWNTVSFVSSLSTILLLISGLPFNRRLFMWILMVIMWLTVTSIAVTYVTSILVVTPGTYSKSSVQIALASVWIIVFGIPLLGNAARLILWLNKKNGITPWWPTRFTSLVMGEHNGQGQRV